MPDGRTIATITVLNTETYAEQDLLLQSHLQAGRKMFKSVTTEATKLELIINTRKYLCSVIQVRGS